MIGRVPLTKKAAYGPNPHQVNDFREAAREMAGFRIASELQECLNELGSTLPIIFLSGYTDVPTTVRTIRSGAEDFLTKPVSTDQLFQAVERAIARHDANYRLKSKLDVARARIATLTARERQVFQLVILGKTTRTFLAA